MKIAFTLLRSFTPPELVAQADFGVARASNFGQKE